MSSKKHAEEQDQTQEQPRVVYTIPGMSQARVKKNITYKTVEDLELKLDIYYPQEHQKQRLPAVIMIHGDGSSEFLHNIKDSGQYEAWGQLIAASGMIAVTANHRSTEGLHNVTGVANDIDDLISYVTEQSKALHINADKLCIWTCSAAAYLGLRAALHEAPPFVNCIVCYYSFTDMKAYYDLLYKEIEASVLTPTFSEEDFDMFSATEILARRIGDIPPMFIARAGLDYPELNEALDRFIEEAISQNIELTFMNHPNGLHGFDVLNSDARSEEIIQATLEFMQSHLLQ